MSADIRDVTAIRNFRVALIRFSEEVAAVLDLVRMELQRSVAWIEHDRPLYWSVQTRKAFDDVARTRTALSTCQLRTVAGRHPACIEEKVAFEKAKRRLQQCQDQIEAVRHWAQKLNHESNEFRGRLSSLQRLIEGDIPQMLALLERMAAILDAYADLGPPPESAESLESASDEPGQEQP